MKAKELAEILLQHPDRIVVKSRDDEGNGYQEVYQAESDYNFIDDGCDSYIKLETLTDEYREVGYSEEDTDIDNEGIPAIVLW